MAWRGFVTTIATTMSPRKPDACRLVLRCAVPGALVGLAPKCILCVAGYLGIGTALGWNGVELCGVQPSNALHRVASTAALVGASLGFIAATVRFTQRRRAARVLTRVGAR